MKKELGIFVLLVILCVVVSWLNPAFLSAYNLTNTARNIGVFGIYSIGLGIVIITGGIDLSVGSVFALLGVVLSIMLAEWQWHWMAAVPIALGLAGALGAGHGFLIAKMRLQPFIVTLCGLLVYRGIARYIAGDTTKGFGSSDYGMLRQLVTGKLFGVPMPLVFLVVIAAVMWVVVHRSAYGRYLFAVGGNEEAARYSGINTRLVIGSAYVLGLLLAGVSGVILALDTNSISASDFGNAYELYGIAAAVLGGCSLRGGEGSVVGIVIGTALLQVLQNIIILLRIPSSLNFAVMGTVILIGVLVDQIIAQRRARQRMIGIPVT